MDHIEKYRKAIRQAKDEGRFEGWFNCSRSRSEVDETARRDFETIYAPVADLIPDHHTALEIGHGGGRLLRECAKHFDTVIGLDIHDEPCDVPENVITIVGDGATIPVDRESVDFIYSFIVLHHLEKLSDFISYLKGASDALVPGGIARLFYFACGARYEEIAGKGANHVSFLVSEPVAISFAVRHGFEVLGAGRTKGRQSYLTLRKG